MTGPIQFFDECLAARKGHTHGTHRTRPPSETLDLFARLGRQMGITRLADITGLDSIGLPVYTAIRPNSRSLATSQGKGVDAASAKASALMEAIESWHAEHIDAGLRWDSYLGLRKRACVIDVDRLARLRGRGVTVDSPRPWIEGYDLVQHEPIWLPFDVVSLYFVSDGGRNSVPFLQSSTGLASGNHLLEAMSHGICEAIERDAEAEWLASDEDVQIDLDTIDDPCCRLVLDLLWRAEVYAAVWDMTSDIGVPAYASVIMDRPDPSAWRVHGAYSGFGCHLSPAIAVLRSLTEAVQSRATFIAGSRDDMFRTDYTSLQQDEGRRARWDDLRRRRPRSPFVGGSGSRQATETFEGDVAALLATLVDAGIDRVIAVNLTKAELSIPVVKIVIPGLQEASEDGRPGEPARSRRHRRAAP